MKTSISNTDMRTIHEYVLGRSIPSGRRSPSCLIRRLSDVIEALEEYEMFQTAGPFQQEFSQRLEQYRNLRTAVRNIRDWYKDAGKNTDETPSWQMEFHRLGMEI